MSNGDNKPNIFVRIAVIAGMLLILFFIAAAIVKYVPRIISAMSPANVSLTSLFNPDANNGSATSTEASTPATATSSAPVQSQTSAPKPTANQPQTGGGYVYTYPTYTGPADLAISLVKVGQVASNGSFIQTNSIQPGSRVQAQFNINNVGSGRSGSWNLNAVLPTSIIGERVYNSQAQPTLNPGDSYQMTLAFDSYDPSQQAIQISIVGGNDANQGNNILVIPVTSSGNYGGNTSGCYWSNGYQYCNNNYYNNAGQSICYGTNNIPYYCNNNYNYNNSGSDLSVTITNVGTMDRNTGQFYYTNSSSFSRYDKVAVQFEVRNLGGASSGNWTFTGNLPSSSQSSYSSNTQNSLAPGQTMSFTLGFDNPNVGSQSFSIQLYPQGTDSNSGNNYASRSIYINN